MLLSSELSNETHTRKTALTINSVCKFAAAAICCTISQTRYTSTYRNKNRAVSPAVDSFAYIKAKGLAFTSPVNFCISSDFSHASRPKRNPNQNQRE